MKTTSKCLFSAKNIRVDENSFFIIRYENRTGKVFWQKVAFKNDSSTPNLLTQTPTRFVTRYPFRTRFHMVESEHIRLNVASFAASATRGLEIIIKLSHWTGNMHWSFSYCKWSGSNSKLVRSVQSFIFLRSLTFKIPLWMSNYRITVDAGR